MDIYDAFTAGVENGGLINTSEIKALICFLLLKNRAIPNNAKIIDSASIVKNNTQWIFELILFALQLLKFAFEIIKSLSPLWTSGFFTLTNGGSPYKKKSISNKIMLVFNNLLIGKNFIEISKFKAKYAHDEIVNPNSKYQWCEEYP